MSVNSSATALQELFEVGLEVRPEAREGWLQGLAVEDALKNELRHLLAADSSDATLGAMMDGCLRLAVEPLPCGARLGPYRILSELGSGGMGAVFLAERADREFEARVAIKVLHGFPSQDANRRLRQERQILADLAHPNIARLLDGGTTEAGQPYLVLEYIEGRRVNEACAQSGLGIRERAALIRDLALAVHFAHTRLVLHGDIKPANVLVRTDGRPVLLDFGIARILDEENGRVQVTQRWFTPAYASPEQKRGEAIGTASDTYALGLLLGEVLSGEPPTLSESGELALPSHRAPAPTRRLLQGDLDNIVRKATSPATEDRYQSAREFAEDIQRHLDGVPVRAMPDRVAYRARKFVARHPKLIAATAIALAAIGVSVWRMSVERSRAQHAERLANTNAQAAEAVSDFLVGMFAEADNVVGDHASASPTYTLVTKAEAKVRNDGTLVPAQRAELLRAVGSVYANLGRPYEATHALEDALSEADAAERPASERAQLALQLGETLVLREEYEQAKPVLQRARESFGQASDEDGAARAQSLLGVIASGNISDPEEAIRITAAARQHFLDRYGAEHLETLRSDVYYAMALSTNREKDATRLLEATIPKLEQRLAKNSTETIVAKRELANLLWRTGRLDEAIAVLQPIVDSDAGLKDSASFVVDSTLAQFSIALLRQGRLAEAEAYAVRGLEISERIYHPNDVYLQITRGGVAWILFHRWDFDRAIPLAEQGLRTLQAAAGSEHERFFLLLAQVNLGFMLTCAGRPAEARRIFDSIDTRGEDVDKSNMGFQLLRRRIFVAQWERMYGTEEAFRQQVAWLQAHQNPKQGTEQSYILREMAHLTAKSDPAAAMRLFEESLQAMSSARSPRYMWVGILHLEAASLAHSMGDRVATATHAMAAREILAGSLIEGAKPLVELRNLLSELD
jgi:tetratricopeptide (TPR) repeat protein/tRNA A-37 threonylcarbamoyl transferase component Bud32